MPSPFKKRAAQALDDSDLRTSLTRASSRLQRWRNQAIDEIETPWPVVQEAGASIRRDALNNLPDLLRRLEAQLERRGVTVAWAEDGVAAFRYIAALAAARGAETVLRSRSPLAEEIGLDAALNDAGIRVVNTHFGDYILDLAEDLPSHPHFPALHQRAADVAAVFESRLDMPQTLDIQAMGSMARFRLRRELLRNEMMVSQVALAAADSGMLALISDAGEDRIGASLARVQVLLMGVEQVTASLDELLFLVQLGSRSASGRGFPGAVTLLSGPAQVGDPDGPGELHLLLVDNGRSALLATPYRGVLACINCGACHNACPVTREIGGHAYGEAFAGPIGSLLAPLLGRTERSGRRKQAAAQPSVVSAADIPLLDPGYSELPLASTLCRACDDACPVAIDLAGMLRSMREERVDAGQAGPTESGLRAAYRWAMANPANYRRLHAWLQRGWIGAVLPPVRRWRAGRDLPAPAAKTFRDRWSERTP